MKPKAAKQLDLNNFYFYGGGLKGSLYIKRKKNIGDGVSVATHTDAGSIPATGGIFLRAIMVSG